MTSDEVTGAAKRVGFWLRMARERANLSQPAAAKMLGLSDKSASTMSAWEAGTREPSPSKLRAMSELYQVPIAMFYDPPLSAYEQIDAMAAAPSERQVIDAMKAVLEPIISEVAAHEPAAAPQRPDESSDGSGQSHG